MALPIAFSRCSPVEPWFDSSPTIINPRFEFLYLSLRYTSHVKEKDVVEMMGSVLSILLHIADVADHGLKQISAPRWLSQTDPSLPLQWQHRSGGPCFLARLYHVNLISLVALAKR